MSMAETQTFAAFPARSDAAELANTVTHAIGLVLSLAGTLAMAATIWRHGDGWRLAGCGIYLASLVSVFALSTLSHACRNRRWKARFRAWDQGVIYLLIAATYTPFALAYLRSWPWWILLVAVWAIALHGFVSKVAFAHRVEAVAVWPCVLLGWIPFLSVPALIGDVPITAMWGMLAGGVCYTIGIVFFLLESKVCHFHAVWHVLVVAGSACHFVTILVFVAAA
jgi:hemolysin III